MKKRIKGYRKNRGAIALAAFLAAVVCTAGIVKYNIKGNELSGHATGGEAAPGETAASDGAAAFAAGIFPDSGKSGGGNGSSGGSGNGSSAGNSGSGGVGSRADSAGSGASADKGLENGALEAVRRAVSSEVGAYVKEFLASQEEGGGGAYISPEQVKELVSELTGGVASGASEEIFTDERYVEELRSVIEKAVAEQVEEYNRTANPQNVSSGISEEQKTYIRESIVPNLTAQITANADSLKALKASVESAEGEYKTDKKQYTELFAGLNEKLLLLKNGSATTDDVKEMQDGLRALEGILDAYKAQNNDKMLSLSEQAESEHASLEAKVGDVKTGLEAKVGDVQAGLQTEAAARDAAIKNATDSMNRQFSESLLEGLQGLSAEVEADRTLANEAHEDLEERLDALDASLAQGLDGVTITYRDGHFYATSEDGISKKLDYAE